MLLLLLLSDSFLSNAVDRGFEPRSCQGYANDICCFSSNSLRSIKEKEQILISSESG